jgi:hypothetical protein
MNDMSIEAKGPAMSIEAKGPVKSPPPRSAHAAPQWILWIAGGFGVLLCAFAFLLWGRNGPSYILDLIAAFCG